MEELNYHEDIMESLWRNASTALCCSSDPKLRKGYNSPSFILEQSDENLNLFYQPTAATAVVIGRPRDRS